MEKQDTEKIIENLIEVFFKAGKVSIDLRIKGLKEHTKKDKTPVTNGDIEVNNIIITVIGVIKSSPIIMIR